MATPTLVQSVNGSNNQGNSTTTYKLNLPNGVLSGNTIFVGVNLSGGGTVTVNDDVNAGNYTQDKTISGGQIVKLFRFSASSAGARIITIHMTAGTFVGACACEFYNVSGTPVDVSASAQGTSTTVATGSMTTGTAGDLILQYAVQDTTGAAITSWTQGTSPWALIVADRYDNQVLQYQIQASAGAINSTLTMSPSNHWTTVAVSYKSAATGTAPAAGIRVQSVQYTAFNPNNGFAVGSSTVQFPATGNAYFASFLAEPNINTSGTPTDSNSNTYTSTGSFVAFGTSGNLYAWHADNVTSSTTQTFTFTSTGTQVSGSTLVMFDIVGAAVAPYDIRATGSGNQTGAGSLTAGSISPTSSNGCVISVLGVSSNTVSGVSPGNFVSVVPSPIASPNDVSQNNGWGVNYNANTSSESFIWAQTGGAFGNWAWTADSFKAPAAGGGPTYEDDTFNVILVAPVDPIISVW